VCEAHRAASKALTSTAPAGSKRFCDDRAGLFDLYRQGRRGLSMSVLREYVGHCM
jgi:hypothetical protein